MLDANATQDSIALTHDETILFEDREATHGRVAFRLKLSNLLGGALVVLVLRACVGKKGANGFSASTAAEVSKLSGHDV